MVPDDETFWLVWSPSGPHSPTHKHLTFGSADSEAQRLARLHRGSRFYVLEAKQFTESPPDVVTKTLAPREDMPF